LGSSAREYHLKGLQNDPPNIDALIEACWDAVKR
jgi:hypothetical protein